MRIECPLFLDDDSSHQATKPNQQYYFIRASRTGDHSGNYYVDRRSRTPNPAKSCVLKNGQCADCPRCGRYIEKDNSSSG